MIPTASLLPGLVTDAGNSTSAGTALAPTAAAGSLGKTLLGYLLAAGLAVAVLVVALRLWRADLRVAFIYEGDGCYYLSIVKTVAETGWYYHNDRIGQLGGLDYRDFPTADGWLHMAIIHVLTRTDPDPFLVSNLFYLLCFPLTVLTSLFVCRRLGLSYPVGLSVSLLYTFTPFHLMRKGHPFLAAYYLIPLAVLLAVRLYQGQLPFRRAGEGGRDRWGFFSLPALGTLSIAVLTGLGGVYYAFFGCCFVMVAGVARSCAERRLAPAVAGGLACGVTFAALLVSLWPSIEYKLTQPKNCEAAQRCAWEAEVYGLKITQMLLPVSDHRYAPLRHLKARYNRSGTPLVNENDTSSLGLLGAAGFLVLMGRLFLRHRTGTGKVMDALALLALFAVLLATVGGIGSVISVLFSPWIRAYNRISIYIAFFALMALGLLLQRLGRQWSDTPRRRFAFAALLTGLLTVGLFDQTNASQVPPYKEMAEQTASERRFVERVEANAPVGGLVYQLPYAFYPEGHLYNEDTAYHLLRPYLHSRHLRWTFGGIRGHLGDEWAKTLSRMPVEPMLGTLAQAEFAGVCVDREGYADKGHAVEADLRAVLGVEPLVAETGRHSYFDLRPFTEKLRAGLSPAEWQQCHEAALHPVVPLLRNGFHTEERFPDQGYGHWSSRSGELHLRNDLDRERVVRLRMRVDLPAREQPATLRVQGPGWAESVEIKATTPRVVESRLTLAPGNHVIRMECDAPPITAAEDPWRRRLVFRVTNLECEEEVEPAK